jgi:hypothetical protein
MLYIGGHWSSHNLLETKQVIIHFMTFTYLVGKICPNDHSYLFLKIGNHVHTHVILFYIFTFVSSDN